MKLQRYNVNKMTEITTQGKKIDLFFMLSSSFNIVLSVT